MSARVAIRSVKFKAGGEVRVLRAPVDENRAKVERMIRETLEAAGSIAGFALILWDNKNFSTTNVWVSEESQIPCIMVPDYIRNLLLARQIENWTIDTVNGVTYTPDRGA